jgi:hypothetical protein
VDIDELLAGRSMLKMVLSTDDRVRDEAPTFEWANRHACRLPGEGSMFKELSYDLGGNRARRGLGAMTRWVKDWVQILTATEIGMAVRRHASMLRARACR